MFSESDCREVRKLSNNLVMKIVLVVKILLNLIAAGLILAVVRTCRKKKLFVMHRNIRFFLYFHFYYVIHVAVFMLVGLIYDFVRLSQFHEDDCDYLIPVWITFPIKCSFVFGVFAETITIAFISIERFVATYYTRYESVQCRVMLPMVICAKIIFVFLISYVMLGYQIEWSTQLVVFTFRTNENNKLYEVLVTYTLASVEICSILLYHFTLYVNHRETRALLLTKSRENQLEKSLSQKYQMEENTKVIRLVLPIVWSHFICCVIFGVCQTVYAKLNGSINSEFFAIYVEATTTNVYYAITMSVLFLVLQSKLKKRSIVDIVQKTGTYRSADEYHRQLSTIFASHSSRPSNPRA